MSNDVTSSSDGSGDSAVVHINLREDQAKRFEQIKSHLSQHLGYDPTNPEVLGMLMATKADESDREVSKESEGAG